MREPVWLVKEFVQVIHEEMLAEFGGSAGIRDEGLLESALGKPKNLLAYEKPNLFDLAASYAAGIVRNHPFIDGNKRTGFMAAYTFLTRNGVNFKATQADSAAAVLALASIEMTEKQFSGWLKEKSQQQK